jgi:hypothetical protein
LIFFKTLLQDKGGCAAKMGPLGEPSLPGGNGGAAKRAGGAAAPIENKW